MPETVIDAGTTMVRMTIKKPLQSSVIRTMKGRVQTAMGV